MVWVLGKLGRTLFGAVANWAPWCGNWAPWCDKLGPDRLGPGRLGPGKLGPSLIGHTWTKCWILE